MVVNNQIRKVTKRTRGFEDFTEERIIQAILGAAKDGGGFQACLLDEPFHEIYHGKSDEEIAAMLTDDVIICLNSNEINLIPYRPPQIELIQDLVEHVLFSRGFVEIGEMYHAYRAGRALIRDKEIREDQFAGSGYPHSKLEKVKKWHQEHECDTLEKVNEWVKRGKLKELIDASIAVYEESLDEAARKFMANPHVRVLVITGPSSSGKTTTTHKLCERLRKEGIRFKSLELDNYFWNLQQHPRDSFGDYNYEVPESLDLILINKHVGALLAGETIYPPKYNFNTGNREPSDKPFKLADDEVLLLDSLYGLFPPMTASVEREKKFQLYIETLTTLYFSGYKNGKEFLPFTDYRLLRRMLRDEKYRNHPIERTLGHWHYVRKGELGDIIPRINVADIIINGGLAFELPVLKQAMGDSFPPFQHYLEQRRLDPYIRGKRVKNILDHTISANVDLDDMTLIPEDCHLREFIGGSKYKSLTL
ncbi:MAG: hypothetical protein D6785_06475 [Planctomycetota bacterium]|nr:MAG: hypothetical protein D6785_06475 [Planctomycetota bacterium]